LNEGKGLRGFSPSLIALFISYTEKPSQITIDPKCHSIIFCS
jgi:hypothetical protein